jgi:hypothetical protein
MAGLIDLVSRGNSLSWRAWVALAGASAATAAFSAASAAPIPVPATMNAAPGATSSRHPQSLWRRAPMSVAVVRYAAPARVYYLGTLGAGR